MFILRQFFSAYKKWKIIISMFFYFFLKFIRFYLQINYLPVKNINIPYKIRIFFVLDIPFCSNLQHNIH